MKHLLFFSSLILFPFFASTQSIINKNTWVGQNKEYLTILKTTAFLQKGMEFQAFEVAKYVKNNYIILSRIKDSIEFKTKYNIVRISQDTLILSPEGEDFFELSEPNSQNQYVFVNSMLAYKFVKLQYKTALDTMHHDYEIKAEHLESIYILDIDSAKKSKLTVIYPYFNETKTYTSPVSKKDYKRLIKILSHCDIDSYPNETTWINNKENNLILDLWYNNQKIVTYNGCFPTGYSKEGNSILEIWYNDQKKIFNGCFPIGYLKLEDFIWEYMSLIEGFDVIRVRRK